MTSESKPLMALGFGHLDLAMSEKRRERKRASVRGDNCAKVGGATNGMLPTALVAGGTRCS